MWLQFTDVYYYYRRYVLAWEHPGHVLRQFRRLYHSAVRNRHRKVAAQEVCSAWFPLTG